MPELYFKLEVFGALILLYYEEKYRTLLWILNGKIFVLFEQIEPRIRKNEQKFWYCWQLF